MGLDDLDPDTVDEDDPKFQAIIFPNPYHEEMENYVLDEEQAEEFYIHARWLKGRLGNNSSVIIGKFIQAIREGEDEDDWKKLDDIVSTLKGEDES